MSTDVRPLSIVLSQKEQRLCETIETSKLPRRLYRTIGSVTYLILPKPKIVTRILEKAIAQDVAKRLVKLGTVNELFTLDIYANAATIPSFTDAACLEDILDLGEDWWFDPEHCKMFAADVGTPR
jgi:hypothetical protein